MYLITTDFKTYLYCFIFENHTLLEISVNIVHIQYLFIYFNFIKIIRRIFLKTILKQDYLILRIPIFIFRILL